jgi:hypothetical protein
MGAYRDFLKENAVFVIIFIIILLAAATEPLTQWWIGADDVSVRECPFATKGNREAELTVRYCTSPNCPYCWVEEVNLGRLIKEKGEMFTLEKYDIRFCRHIAKEHNIVGTPSFVFIAEGEEDRYFGYRSGEKLEEIICGIEEC